MSSATTRLRLMPEDLAPVRAAAFRYQGSRELEAGVHVETETFKGLLHGFVRATASIAKARDAMSKAVAFIRQVK